MSKVQKPIILDETGKQIAEHLQTQNMLLNIIAGTAIANTSNLEDIHNIVRSGKASELFHIGDQIVVPWTDKATGITYQVPHDIVHFGNVTLADGETVPAMYLQWHYATPFGVQFDNYEALYHCKDAVLKAGTYNITMGNSWGDNVVADKTYQFTLTKDVPMNGVLCGFRAMPDQAPANWTVTSYATITATEAIETVKVTEGNAGTSLGTLSANTPYSADAVLNAMHRVGYGYNRWSQSAMRQWLNSDADVNGWWTPQNQFDRAPDQLATKAGFMSGYNDDFLKCLGKIKVTTALNTVTDGDIEEDDLEDTYDTFFLPALVNMHIAPQLAGEGEIFDYWKRVSESATPLAQYGTYPQMRTFAIENPTSPQYVRLRSSSRGYAGNTWYVYSSGYVSHSNAISAIRSAPVCAMC